MRDAWRRLVGGPPDPDKDSLTARSHERYRRVALTTVTSVLARGIQVGVSLVTIPLTLHYLGLERYGMWITISSTLALLSFADLGIGHGLLNLVAEAHGRDDRRAAREYVSSAFVVLSGLALAIGVLFFLIYPVVPWSRIFNVTSPQAVSEAGPALAVFVVAFLVSIPLGIVQRIRLGYQEGYIDAGWSAAGAVGTLVTVFAAITAQASVPWLVAAATVPGILAQVLQSIHLLGWQRPWLRPGLDQLTRPSMVRILRTGGYFLVLQVATTICYQIDAIVIAQILGAEAVSQYAVPSKLFQVATIVLSVAYMALWPAYGEAMSRGDLAWARQAFFRSLRVGLLIAIPLSLALVVSGAAIVEIWVGPQVRPEPLLLAALGTWGAMGAVNWSLAAFLNGIGALRVQAFAATVMTFVNLCLSILLTQHLGLSGVVWGTVLAQITCLYVPYYFYLRRVFRSRAS